MIWNFYCYHVYISIFFLIIGMPDLIAVPFYWLKQSSEISSFFRKILMRAIFAHEDIATL